LTPQLREWQKLNHKAFTVHIEGLPLYSYRQTTVVLAETEQCEPWLTISRFFASQDANAARTVEDDIQQAASLAK
jgi:hypothetical protein